MDVVAWLHGLGLEQYAPAFRQNAIDDEVLRELTVDDLKDLGITLVGHRRKLLAAISALRNDPEEPSALIAATAGARSGPGAGSRTDTAERRQLTVMFCDLVGSTALSRQADPEDLRDLLNAYHACCAESVTRFGGCIAKYMGDGVLAYFGFPRAHEDDPIRAIHGGLAILSAIPKLPSKAGLKPRARIGIATGLVVVGDLIGEGAARESNVVGETPHLAARLQNLADPSTLVVAEGTRRLAGRLFEYHDLGNVKLKGFSEGIQAWQVIGTSTAESRFEADHHENLVELVGREEELELLLRRWRQVKDGEGRAVLVSGEPGIGKSRLVRAIGDHLAAESHVRLRYFCSPYHADSALHPFINQLERAAGFERDDAPEAKFAKLEALLAATATPSDDIALLADLLSIPAASNYPPPAYTPQRKKELILQALLRQLDELARHRPVLLIFEDAHWIDPTSRELLDRALDHVRTLPVLILITHRPEFHPPWIDQPHVTVLALSRLGRPEGLAMIRLIAGGKRIPTKVLEQVVERADGVPLFVEELTKTVLESGSLREEADQYVALGPAAAVTIPDTLQASLIARLARLSAVKEVAQTAAVIGRVFSHTVVAAASSLPNAVLRHGLDQLVEAGLVFRRGEASEATYTFKHALVQDAAYASLLKSRRQQHVAFAPRR
jgi:class 3 adenylate cyclase